MKNNLAERLERVLMQDKAMEPTKLLPALKSDLRDILREYAELNEDINETIDLSIYNDDKPSPKKPKFPFPIIGIIIAVIVFLV